LKDSIYLPYINNEKPHALSAQYKQRFSSLNRVELVKFGADTIIYPSESTHFGSFDLDGKVHHMKDTDLYKNDTIGLRYLDENDRLYLREVPGKQHLDFDDNVILKEFVPFLYEKEWPTNNVY